MAILVGVLIFFALAIFVALVLTESVAQALAITENTGQVTFVGVRMPRIRTLRSVFSICTARLFRFDSTSDINKKIECTPDGVVPGARCYVSRAFKAGTGLAEWIYVFPVDFGHFATYVSPGQAV